MLRVAAFVLLLIATLMILFTFTAGRFGVTAFLVFGLTVWCFSTIWDRGVRG
jgi:hypothetical protein